MMHVNQATSNSLKTAWKMLVHRLGGVDAVAACTRASKSMTSEYGNVYGERWAPVDVILDAELIAGEPLVTAALARAQGFELVPVVAQGEGELPQHLARIGETTAEVFRAASVALADSELTDAERVDVAARCGEARLALHAAEAALLKPMRVTRPTPMRAVG